MGAGRGDTDSEYNSKGTRTAVGHCALSFRTHRDLGLVDVHAPLAPELEPERGGVDDDRARAGPVHGEGLGGPAEEAGVLGAAPRRQ
eukprot:3233987-Pyramimonas_sp.AAC.1